MDSSSETHLAAPRSGPGKGLESSSGERSRPKGAASGLIHSSFGDSRFQAEDGEAASTFDKLGVTGSSPVPHTSRKPRSAALRVSNLASPAGWRPRHAFAGSIGLLLVAP
jgi:hypothetical protein